MESEIRKKIETRKKVRSRRNQGGQREMRRGTRFQFYIIVNNICIQLKNVEKVVDKANPHGL